jgi:DNA-binding GntR family transcriptional regulator
MNENESSRFSLRQKVYAAIKKDIITCTLKPGEPLSENQFVERFQVSKTPIREALTSLQQDRLVEYIPNRGFMVSPISVKDVQEIFDARAFYEAAIFKLALKRMVPGDVEMLEGYSKVDFDASSPDAINLAMEANLNFHLCLAKIAGNSRLYWHYAHLLDEAQRLIYLDFKSSNILPMWHSTHHGIVDSLHQRDEAAGIRSIEETLELAKRRILRAE